MASNVSQIMPDFILEDLAKSGLEVPDMNIRPMTSTERHATGSPQSTEGYVIPYRSIGGVALPFYRVRLQNWDPKYKQLTDEPNHIYFPKGFWDEAQEADYILFVEGEKKASCAAKKGFACVAAGGVDSWSNKTVSLPKDAKLTKAKDGRIVAKIGAGLEQSGHEDELASGMKELIDLIVGRDIPLVIVYDSDLKGRVAPQVQAAAARLGYSLRFHGVPAKNIRQFVIKPPKGYLDEKIALDDLLVRTPINSDQLDRAIRKTLAKDSAFPRHPNPREYINKKLRRSRMTREQLQNLATAILCDLDANGTRLYSKDEDELYYFSRTSKRLMRVSFKLNQDYAKSPWGVHLYQNYNLSSADERVLLWLEALYAGEEPVRAVNPERVIAVRDHAIYYQISAAQMIKVTAKEIRVLDNGSDDILFLADSVEDLDKGKLVDKINPLLKEGAALPNYWFDVTSRTRLADDEQQRHARLLSYLYSISPWFYRWQGTQLPVEMVVGEPGSGKAQALHSKVLTPTGWRTMGELQVGDEVLTPKGKVTRIVAVHPQGPKQLFKVTLNDGSSTLCCGEHLWNVQNQNDKMHGSRFNRGLHPSRGRLLTEGEKSSKGWNFFKTKSLNEIMSKPLVAPRGKNLSRPVNMLPNYEGSSFFQDRDLPIAPYTMGALLGDGSFRTGQINITCHPSDTQIIQEIKDEGYTLSDPIGKRGIRYNLLKAGKQPFIELSLWNKTSLEKHIPPQYLEGSTQQRLSLLQGLMDTDGTCHGSSNTPVFNTSSYQLACDVQLLVRSLGGTSYLSERTAPVKSGSGQLAYNIAIRLPTNMVPFRLERKVTAWKAVKHQEPVKAIKSIEPWGIEEAKCITLEDPSGLYVTDDYIVTHNSTLFQLRLNILNGRPRLRNPAKDIGDWGVSVGSTGGIHVTDNINMMNSQLRQMISDEMCRLITEPQPMIEKRKLYTDNDTVLIPIKTVFAVTSVKQPFNAADLIQRSIITYMDKGSETVEYKGDWAAEQLEKFGGREGWLACQLVFIHRMLKEIESEWDNNYRAKSRLVNFEQLLRFSARLYGDDPSWLVEYMESTQAEKIAENDVVLGGLNKFASLVMEKYGEYTKEASGRFTTKDITKWALQQEEYKDVYLLTNSRSLGKFMKQNPNMLATVAGISEHGTKSNATAYHAHNPKR